MALFPCDKHGDRYAGKQQTIYPAIINGTDAIRERRRLCRDCFADALQECAMKLGDATNPNLSNPACCECGVDEAAHPVFVTAYADGQDRQDFYGRLCRGCLGGNLSIALFGRQISF